MKKPTPVKATARDRALIAAATKLIRARYKEGRHHIAAAVRTRGGRIHTGLHLDTYVGRASVCAEAGAVGTALAAGDGEIVAVVSVRHPRAREANQEIHVVSPCGVCRELLADFAPDCEVIIEVRGRLAHRRPRALLPDKYVRRP